MGAKTDVSLSDDERRDVTCDCEGGDVDCPFCGDDSLWIDKPAAQVVATIERLIADHVSRARADALRQAHDEIHALNPPAYPDAPQYREGLIDGHGVAAATCLALIDAEVSP